MSFFNKEKDEMLIELVKCNHILYDASHGDYKSNVLKHKVWENISKSLEIPGKLNIYYFYYIIISCIS